jgi:hypothetical protein
MPEPADQPTEQGRSLAGFYIALGVVAGLVLLGVWLSTPLRVWYWERQIQKPLPPCPASNAPGYDAIHALYDEQSEAAVRLVEIGPRSAPAVTRLLRRGHAERWITLWALQRVSAKWALPILVEECRERNDPALTLLLVDTAERITGEFIQPPEGYLRVKELPPQLFLAWWEREGQAKYGGGGK